MPLQRFRVIDACNGFYVYDRLTDREACLGDGVDMFFDGLTCGMPGFTQAWEDVINESPAVYLETYFTSP